MSETQIQKEKITLGLIASWGLGSLSLVVGITAFSDPGMVGAAVPFFIVAILLLPPIRSFFFRKTGKSLSTGVRMILVLVFMVIGTAAVSPNSNFSAPTEYHVQISSTGVGETATASTPVAAASNTERVSDDIKARILQRCKMDMGEYGAALVKACVDQDTKAHSALQSYPAENAAVIDRCKMDNGEYGWALVKACVDQDIKAQKALADY